MQINVVNHDNIYIQDFQNLFNDFYIPLCIFAEKYLDNNDDAADIVQDTFLKLWQRKDDFQHINQIKSFLYTSIRNSCLNELEHKRVVENYSVEIQTLNLDSFFHDHVIEEETYRIIVEAINKLPPQTAKVMMLALSGKNNKEIADAMSISEGTIHTHKKIAYKRLRKYLQDYFYSFLILAFLCQ
ncbi:MAG: RNA polymerase sigma-70 factor [Dysgonamonadaceae bacterium]|jgi:RNA polymerase sigma-70 factor (ECF subfamily)|nr:RNA polymerase sigma-70 factor [Dysgonamonadaceae bacterium]